MATFERWFFDECIGKYDVCDRDRNVRFLLRYMLNRTQQLFRYDGLPETINARVMELYLQINGYCGIAEYDGELYAYRGGLGGEPDEYYEPTLFTTANPYQNMSKSMRIGSDCIVIRNDGTYTGVLPMLLRYCTQIVDNEISLHNTSIWCRTPVIMSASDDTAHASAEKYVKDLADGKIGVIADSKFLEGVKVHPVSQAASNTMRELIEHEQYLKASLFNELGLNANYNMKRETLTDSENAMNSDALLPLIDNMLCERREGVERVNAMFGTSITVDYSSAWQDNAEELELQKDVLKAEGEQTVENPVDTVENGGDNNESNNPD